ncbi:hypothetical protein EJ08DRAFT_699658 [Tothia fuscella]|uniref:Uncharacterized protein n=1 Tax=Tothia fuscella TaxID=1048955 RepID=A0A9P4NMG2_9PEZI|nr:hypothetical protein EJ08DRAFT_699658 [Tothia fuscella]
MSNFNASQVMNRQTPAEKLAHIRALMAERAAVRAQATQVTQATQTRPLRYLHFRAESPQIFAPSDVTQPIKFVHHGMIHGFVEGGQITHEGDSESTVSEPWTWELNTDVSEGEVILEKGRWTWELNTDVLEGEIVRSWTTSTTDEDYSDTTVSEDWIAKYTKKEGGEVIDRRNVRQPQRWIHHMLCRQWVDMAPSKIPSLRYTYDEIDDGFYDDEPVTDTDYSNLDEKFGWALEAKPAEFGEESRSGEESAFEEEKVSKGESASQKGKGARRQESLSQATLDATPRGLCLISFPTSDDRRCMIDWALMLSVVDFDLDIFLTAPGSPESTA